MKKIFLTLLFVLFICSCVVANASAEEWLWPTPTSRMNTTWITQKYKSSHLAIDIGGNHGSDPIYASKSGTVVARFDGCTCRSEGRGGCSDNNRELGNFVIIDHGNGEYSRYCHLYYKDVAPINSYVKQGDIIGYMGSTGSSTGVHLDFRIYQGGTGIQTYSNGYGAYEQKVIGGTTLNNNPKNVYSDGNITYITNANPSPSTPPDTEAPTISNLNVKDISGDSFTVECNLNDNVGVTRLWYVLYAPGGTYEFGESASSGYYSKKFYTKDYGGAGEYSFHLYAYDEAKNSVKEGYSTFNAYSDSELPTIEVLDETNVSSNSFTINCNLNDNVGVTRVWLIIYKDGKQVDGYGREASNGHYSHTIDTTQYGGSGTYEVHVYAYDDKNNQIGVSTGYIHAYSKPENPWINIDKYNIGINSDITFTYFANNATNYSLWLFKDGVSLGEMILPSTGVFTTKFENVGCYQAYISCSNLSGYVDSNKIEFNVYADVPLEPWIYSEQKSVLVGESITLVYNASYATYFDLGFDRYGERVYGVRRDWNDTTYTTSFDKPGTYTVYVSAYNNYGFTDSTPITFTVHDKPICNFGEIFYGKIINKSCWMPTKNDNSLLRLTEEIGYADELWKFVRMEDGSYEIFSCSTGENLIAETSIPNNVTNVTIHTIPDVNRKQWFIYNCEEGVIIKPKCSEYVLEAENDNIQSGTKIVLNKLSGKSSQIFHIYQGDDVQISSPSMNVTYDNYNCVYLNWTFVPSVDKYKIKIYNADTDELTNVDDVNADTKSYSLTLSPGKYRAEILAYNYYVGKSSEYMDFEIYDVIQYACSVNNDKCICNVTLRLYDSKDSKVLLALYDSEDKLIECQTKDYNSNLDFEFNNYNMVKYAKIMIWDTATGIKPLCSTEVICESEFITE